MWVNTIEVAWFKLQSAMPPLLRADGREYASMVNLTVESTKWTLANQ